MRRPFTLYKEKTQSGLVWYARFWDDTAKKYNRSRSTGIKVEGKREHRYEAEQEADKISKRLETEKTNIPITPALTTAPIACNTVADTPLIQYVADFWTENSEYAIYKRDVKNTP